MSEERKKRKSFVFAAVLLGVIVALFLSEAVVRVFDLAPGLNRVSHGIHRLTNNPDIKYELVPYSIDGYEAINGQGRRDFHYPEKKPADTYRIAVLGDSITFGWASFVWEAWPSMAEFYLNHYRKDKTIRIEVWNFGIRGFGTPEEAALLEDRVLAIDPDLLLIGYCLNDPDEFSVDLVWNYRNMNWSDEQYLEGLVDAWRTGFRKFLYTRVKLYTFLKYRILALQRQKRMAENKIGRELNQKGMQVSFKTLGEDYFFQIHRDGWERVRSGFERIGRTVREHQLPTMVVLFPDFADLDDYKYAALHKKVGDEAKKNGLAVFDLLPAYLDARKLFPGMILGVERSPIHPTREGQRIAGFAVAEHLALTALVPGGPEAYEPALFNFETAQETPDAMKNFGDHDMFWIEWGIYMLMYDHYEAALKSFKRAHAQNPDNLLAPEGLRRLLKKTNDPEITRAAEDLLKKW